MPDPIVEAPAAGAVDTPQTIPETPATPATPEAAPADEGTLLGGKEGEAKPDEGQKPTDSAKEGEKPKEEPKLVPEKYEIKLADGGEVDSKLLEAVTPVLKELNISQEGAQKLAEVYAPFVQAQVEAQHKATLDSYKNVVKEWGDETKKALGPNASKELAFAAKFLDSCEEPQKLREFLNQTGVGNHLLVNKAFIRAGKLIAQDSFVDGAKGNPTGGVDPLVMFPTMKK